MATRLAHRGPDDAGSYASGAVALAFRRLSILDLTPAGHQPFLSPDGQIALVYNGEIFNYSELRSELEALGHHFRSTGDTEVLLAAYLQWGIGCLPRLNGMWAFLIHDARTGVVLGSRDRFGVKPLYVVQDGGRWYFASEIKALHEASSASRVVNWGRVAAFLAAGRLERLPADGSTFYAAVKEVAPGTWFVLEPDGRMRTGTYWELPEEDADVTGDPVQEFRDLFLNAVELQLRSDVPVGVALSGGLDSTAIICAMNDLRRSRPDAPDNPLHAFTYHSPQHDESSYVTSTIAATGATPWPVRFTARDWWQGLPRLLHDHDEPVHSASASVGYEIYRAAAARGIKVMLSGQGADETLGGYPSYFHDQWVSLLGRRQAAACWRDISDWTAAHGGSRARWLVNTLQRLVLVGADRIGIYRHLVSRRRWASTYPHHEWLAPHLAELLPSHGIGAPKGLRAALTESTTRTSLPLYLRMEDRNSMAHSVEARVPFLDHRLVSLAFRLAGRWKVRGRWNKYLLREASRGLMPEQVRTRLDKMGFPTPMGQWLAGELRSDVSELLMSPEFRQRGVLNADSVLPLLEERRPGLRDPVSPLFNVVQAELWLRGLGADARG